MAEISEIMPSGTPIRNTARHPKKSTTTPLTTGPPTAPIPTIVMNRPITLPRSLGGKVARAIAMPLAWIIAAPIPWNSRAAITAPRDGDNPVKRAPAIKMTNPTT